MKSEITSNERLQLLALITLAQKHYKVIGDIEESIAKVLDVEAETWGYDLGHFQDILYEEDVEIDALLAKAEIEVVDDKDRCQMCTRPLSEGCGCTEGDTSKTCVMPPAGWYCSRGKGHSGPCAARPDARITKGRKT